MKIPEDCQQDFITYFFNILGPTFHQFGALKHELSIVETHEIIPKQAVETNRFIERVFFKDSFSLPDYFKRVKADPVASQLSRSYEAKFGAYDIQLRVLKRIDVE